MSLIRKWAALSLVKRILIGLLLGVIFGLTLPSLNLSAVNSFFSLLGSLFVSALKALAPILVFVIVMHSLSLHQKGTNTNMKKVIILYLIGTVSAALCAVAASFMFPTTLTLVIPENMTVQAPDSIAEVFSGMLNNMVTNPLTAIANANYLGVLLWAVIFGLALRNASDQTKNILGDVANAMSTAIRWVINCAPFGIMGLVYNSIATTGLDSFIEYGKIILVLVCCMFFVALIMNPLIVFLCTRKNPYPLVFKCIKYSGLVAFFTRSSAANIPVNMSLCEKLGLDEKKYSVSIPLGATINMSGAAITITVLTLAAANTLGITVDFPTALLLSVISAAAACGASGVAGGSLLLIPLACSLFGINADLAMQVVSVGFIIGVIQDSCETALNSSSDVLFTATAEMMNERKAKKA